MKHKLLKDLKKGELIDINLGEGITEEVVEFDRDWKPKDGEYYYYIYTDRDIGCCQNGRNKADKWRISQGSCFKTKEQAEWYRDNVLAVEGELRGLADWEGEAKFCLYYCKDDNRIKSLATSYCDWHGDFYFETTESAKAAIEKIGEERLKVYFLNKR